MPTETEYLGIPYNNIEKVLETLLEGAFGDHFEIESTFVKDQAKQFKKQYKDTFDGESYWMTEKTIGEFIESVKDDLIDQALTSLSHDGLIDVGWGDEGFVFSVSKQGHEDLGMEPPKDPQ